MEGRYAVIVHVTSMYVHIVAGLGETQPMHATWQW